MSLHHLEEGVARLQRERDAAERDRDRFSEALHEIGALLDDYGTATLNHAAWMRFRSEARTFVAVAMSEELKS